MLGLQDGSVGSLTFTHVQGGHQDQLLCAVHWAIRQPWGQVREATPHVVSMGTWIQPGLWCWTASVQIPAPSSHGMSGEHLTSYMPWFPYL